MVQIGDFEASNGFFFFFGEGEFKGLKVMEGHYLMWLNKIRAAGIEFAHSRIPDFVFDKSPLLLESEI